MILLHEMKNLFYTFEQIEKSIHDDSIQNVIPEENKPFKKSEFEEEKIV